MTIKVDSDPRASKEKPAPGPSLFPLLVAHMQKAAGPSSNSAEAEEEAAPPSPLV